jgi:hypothetical protein
MAMPTDKEPFEDLSAIAAQTMEKTRGAVDNYFNFLQKTMSSYPWGGSELADTLKGFAEQNVTASHEYVRKLSQAKTLQDVIQIQTEFMQTQLNSFAGQAKKLGEVYVKVATGAMKTTANKLS